MKQVLIIGEIPLFRDYLKEKLTAEKLEVETCLGMRDGLNRIYSVLPDLIIIDSFAPYNELLEFLQQKSQKTNSSKIPMIISGPELEREQISRLSLFNVVRYFNKPIKVDAFFNAIGKMLGVTLALDTTIGVIETHIQGSIIFVEVSKGLNLEKIILLRYKLAELLTENKIANPKVVLMVSDVNLCFIDGGNLELLLNNVLADPRIRKKNVKVLTMDKFTKALVEGREEYKEIEVSESITTFLPSIIPSNSDATDTSEQIVQHILTAEKDVIEGSLQMRFLSDGGSAEENTETAISVAIVDDDEITRKLLEQSFSVINAQVELFERGEKFLNSTIDKTYDIVILDILMPEQNGFEVLEKLKRAAYTGIVIVYSSISQREAVIKSLSLGASSYLIKPLRPEQVVQKAIEILHTK